MNFSFRGHYHMSVTSLVTRKRGGLFVQLESSCIVANEACWVLNFILVGNLWILGDEEEVLENVKGQRLGGLFESSFTGSQQAFSSELAMA